MVWLSWCLARFTSKVTLDDKRMDKDFCEGWNGRVACQSL